MGRPNNFSIFFPNDFNVFVGTFASDALYNLIAARFSISCNFCVTVPRAHAGIFSIQEYGNAPGFLYPAAAIAFISSGVIGVFFIHLVHDLLTARPLDDFGVIAYPSFFMSILSSSKKLFTAFGYFANSFAKHFTFFGILAIYLRIAFSRFGVIFTVVEMVRHIALRRIFT